MKFTKKIGSVLLVALLLNYPGYSQDQNISSNEPLTGVISEVDELLNKYKKQLKENDNEILRNQITIKKSQQLQFESQKSNNKQAESVARQAEQTAQEALSKNNGNKTKLNSIIGKLNTIKLYTEKAVSVFKTDSHIKIASIFCSGSITLITKTGTVSGCDNQMTLKSGDIIKTGKESNVLLLLDDGSKVKVCQNTEFQIPNTKSAIEIAEGKLSLWIKKYHKKFEVRTPSAVTSVRGTNFETNYSKDGGFETLLFDGEVEIENLVTKDKVILKAGQKINIDPKGKTIGPVEFENKEIKQWWEE